MNVEDIDAKDQSPKDTTTENVQQQNETDNSVSQYEEQIQKLNQQLAAQKDVYLRTAAEYDNFRKRTEKEKLGIYADATANAVKNLLPVADSITMALMSMKDVSDEYKKGVELINNQLKDCFKKLKIEEFGEINDKFNPDIHNAVTHIEDENFGENVISQVFQKGYKLDGKIIRHAMVQVAN